MPYRHLLSTAQCTCGVAPLKTLVTGVCPRALPRAYLVRAHDGKVMAATLALVAERDRIEGAAVVLRRIGGEPQATGTVRREARLLALRALHCGDACGLKSWSNKEWGFSVQNAGAQIDTMWGGEDDVTAKSLVCVLVLVSAMIFVTIMFETFQNALSRRVTGHLEPILACTVLALRLELSLCRKRHLSVILCATLAPLCRGLRATASSPRPSTFPLVRRRYIPPPSHTPVLLSCSTRSFSSLRPPLTHQHTHRTQQCMKS